MSLLNRHNLLVLIFLCPLFTVLTIISCSSFNKLDGFVYLRINANPTTLDPAFITDVTGGAISAKLFNGLVKLNSALEVTPDIAKNWEITNNGLTYRFYLNKDVYFHNGQKLTSADVAYSFKRVLSPTTQSPNTWVLRQIQGADDYLNNRTSDLSGISIIDNYTIEITLSKPMSAFLKLLTMPAAYIVPKKETEQLGQNFSSSPVGTGPFTLKQWTQSIEITLQRFNNYFDKEANVKGIVYRIIPENLTSITEFLLGNLDILEIPIEAYSMLKNNDKYAALIATSKSLNTYYLGLNMSDRSPFKNIDLRKALYYAIDINKILETYFQNRGRRAKGILPDELRKYSLENPYRFDANKARQLIKQSGFESTIKFYVTAIQESVDMAEIIAYYLKEAGLNIEIVMLEWSAYKEAINNAEADMFWLSWWADYPDAENFLFPLLHSSNFGVGGNRARYENPKVDALIEKLQKSIKLEEINKTAKEIEELTLNDVPYILFWHRNDYIAYQPWIANLNVYPIYNIDKGNDVKRLR
ncbi:peptide ABC transporter substrate-binding protein [Candidatus Magnetoovum chiemensis]|nr:peptide ABC transporter substrate-binding protein [Candidatus Magnetoovum chiemensis]